MKRSIRWYLVRGAMVACITMLTLFLTTGPASAWTQEENQFDQTGSGSGVCGNSSTYPCAYWQEPHYTSITLIFLMDPSLTSSQTHGYDFPTAIQGAFTQWNNAPAWNPYSTQCFNTCQYISGFYYMTSYTCGLYALTSLTEGSPKYGYNPQRGGNEWYTFITYSTTGFNNTVVSWNNNGDWSGSCSSGLHADGGATALHETGHVMSLGHTGDCPSIMNPTCLMQNHLNSLSQNSDIPAIKAIYRGDQQSS
jgi:hypothetical protein